MKIIRFRQHIEAEPEVVSVDMTVQDAELFKYFMRYYGQIKKLEAGGLFQIAGKTFTIHTNSKGEIRRIDTSLVTFNEK